MLIYVIMIKVSQANFLSQGLWHDYTMQIIWIVLIFLCHFMFHDLLDISFIRHFSSVEGIGAHHCCCLSNRKSTTLPWETCRSSFNEHFSSSLWWADNSKWEITLSCTTCKPNFNRWNCFSFIYHTVSFIQVCPSVSKSDILVGGGNEPTHVLNRLADILWTGLT